LATAFGLSALLTTVWVLVLPLVDHRTSGGDTVTYMAMARDPKGVHWVPLAYRGLEPWLANAIGGADNYLVAFRLLTWVSLALAAPAMYLICRRLGGSHNAALFGMAALTCLPMWLFFVFQPYLVDGPAMALMAWSMVALVNGWMAVLPLLLVVTGLARETVLGFGVPIYMWLRQRWVDFGAAWQAILVMAPAVVVTWAIRQATVYEGDSSTLGLMKYGLLQYVGKEVLAKPHWWIFYGIAGSLGMWFVLGLYGRKHGGRLWWLLVPVFAQWLFGSDYARYALYAFPVVMAAGAIALWEHPRRILLIGLVAVHSVSIFVDLQQRGHPAIYTLQPSTWISGGLVVLTAVVLWWPTRTRQPEPVVPAQRASLAG
jgi:hypothetical protein